MEPRVLRGPQGKYSLNLSLGEFFYTMSEKHGEKIAQIDSATGQEESFNSIKKRSVRVAIELSKRGITSKDVIIFCTINCLDNIIPYIAATYLGAKVGSLDPTLSLSHIVHLLNLTEPKMVFIESKSLELIEQAIGKLKNKPQIVVFGQSTKYPTLDDFTQFCKDEETFKPIKISPDEGAVLYFSSGTTGLPKALCISSKSVIDYINQLDYKHNAVMHFSTLYWISGICMVIASFFLGGYRVIVPQFDQEQSFKIIEKYRVTFIFTAGLLAYKLALFKDAEKFNLSSLDTVLIGGGHVSPTQLQKIRATFKDTNVFVGYGMSEAGTITQFLPIRDQKFIPKKLESCGRPACGVTMKIVDIDTRKLLPPYEKGEICVKSNALMNGYYNSDASDVFDDDGFLKTGDIGYYDEDEFVYIVDRLKEMFKYQSWHIVPSAIEAVLLEHPAVVEACVFGLPHEVDGEVPAAFVVLKQGLSASCEEIIEFVGKRVADREKLRAGVKIVESLPKTPSGKLMRREVRAQAIKCMKI